MSQFLPLFPLSLVVFPGEQLRLHIFEERYKQLINECLEQSSTFGIPTVIDQHVVTIATEVKVVAFDRKYANGEMDITTEGIQRVRIDSFFQESPDKLYPGGEITVISDEMDIAAETLEEVSDLLIQFHQALGIHKTFGDEEEPLTAYLIGHHIGLSLKQEYELLSFNREIDRMDYIKKHLIAILPVVEETERLKTKVKMNGHFKNVIPPNF
ncbi:MAG: LON peptidase substrate-binding domain-containing protein [Bacteroidota bacterium]